MNLEELNVVEGIAEMRAQGTMLEMLAHSGRKTPPATPWLLAIGYGQLVTALKPSCAIEIGAHEAGFSARLRRHLPDLDIIAFEANPDVHALHLPRLAPLGIDYRLQAVSSEAGRVRFRVPVVRGTTKMTMGSLMNFGDASGYSVEHEVDAITLDSLERRDAALWIDVEGAIKQVLDGGEQTLRSALCVQVEMETQERWPGQMTDQAVIARMAQFGLTPVARDLARNWQYNAVFVRNALRYDPRVQRFRARYFSQALGQDPVAAGKAADA